ncbi:MAG: hypothetical protein LBB54_06850 [Cellulomonadaceae bacterium]|jgi:hypothetical protein|nr:hypothetical protein [Cellulomonadaceae bacterium]
MFWVIWPVLVIGTLVGAVFLIRHLYRAGVRLEAAAVGSADQLGAAMTAMSDAVAQAEEAGPRTRAVIFDDLHTLELAAGRQRVAKRARQTQRRQGQWEHARKNWTADAWLTSRRKATNG